MTVSGMAQEQILFSSTEKGLIRIRKSPFYYLSEDQRSDRISPGICADPLKKGALKMEKSTLDLKKSASVVLKTCPYPSILGAHWYLFNLGLVPASLENIRK